MTTAGHSMHYATIGGKRYSRLTSFRADGTVAAIFSVERVKDDGTKFWAVLPHWKCGKIIAQIERAIARTAATTSGK